MKLSARNVLEGKVLSIKKARFLPKLISRLKAANALLLPSQLLLLTP